MKKPLSLFLMTLFAMPLLMAQAPSRHVSTEPWHGVAAILYGSDDRYEVEDYPNEVFRDHASSVAGMVGKNKIIANPDGSDTQIFFEKSAKTAHNLCSEESFLEQPVLPICSAFLVAPDILVTAGHCIISDRDCDNFRWVFDYKVGTRAIPNENVYECKEFLDYKFQNEGLEHLDFGIIRLKTAVKDREPLKIRRNGFPTVGTELVTIGHPLGLPMKIADNSNVKIGNIFRDQRIITNIIKKTNYFYANLDTYSGNSGSPVFNERTGLVEGIIIEGEEDFVEDPHNFCNNSVVKDNGTFSAEEKVFRITKVPSLTSIIEDSYKRAEQQSAED